MVKYFDYIDISKESFSFNNRRIIIWGKSFSALRLYVELCSENIDVIGFTDSFVENDGETFAGLPVFSYKKIEMMGDIVIYISTYNTEYQRQILEYVEKLKNATILCRGTVYGLAQYNTTETKKLINENTENIEKVKKFLHDEKSIRTYENLLKYMVTNEKSLIDEIYEKDHQQYFPNEEIFQKGTREVFIDAGAYDGETSYGFSKWVTGKYDKIYLMEPDEIMFHVMEENIKLRKMHNVFFINKGAYSSIGNKEFKNDFLTGSSVITKEGENIIETISIDQLLNGGRATYIKMDIEGVEMEALKGAHNTIEEFKPKLAISIYHKPEDLWEIPYYIKQRYPWYKIYIRHYTPLTTETIMYATN